MWYFMLYIVIVCSTSLLAYAIHLSTSHYPRTQKYSAGSDVLSLLFNTFHVMFVLLYLFGVIK